MIKCGKGKLQLKQIFLLSHTNQVLSIDDTAGAHFESLLQVTMKKTFDVDTPKLSTGERRRFGWAFVIVGFLEMLLGGVFIGIFLARLFGKGRKGGAAGGADGADAEAEDDDGYVYDMVLQPDENYDESENVTYEALG